MRGIGRWTAEMFLMFQLGRLDVWPVDDFGVRKGYGALHAMTEMPAAKALLPLGGSVPPAPLGRGLVLLARRRSEQPRRAGMRV